MNNNKQDILLKNKIEKRERFDTILAYILLIILLGCIVVVVLLKINDKDDVLDIPTDEYTPTYITLDEISTSLNNSDLVGVYISDGVTFSSNVIDNSINVSYIKDDVNLNISIPLVGSELVINIPDENNDIITSIYKEIGNSICMFYGNEERLCRYTLDNMNNDGLDGIRFDNNDDTNTVYITTTKSFTVSNEIVYRNVTVVDVYDNDYILELNDVRVSNINVTNSDTDFTINGDVSRLSDDKSDFSVVVKLYDDTNNLIGENKQEFNSDNVLDSTGTFNINFILSVDLKVENISKYSIEIVG